MVVPGHNEIGGQPAASRIPNSGTRQPISPSPAAPNAEACVSTSALVVAGHMSAALWHGVMR
jgi:hypothetical protein